MTDGFVTFIKFFEWGRHGEEQVHFYVWEGLPVRYVLERVATFSGFT
jgi:hypothetical protein